MLGLVLFAAGGLYLAATALFYAALVRRGPDPTSPGWGRLLLAAGALGHLAHIIIQSLILRVCPVASVRFALSLAALVMVSGFLAGAQRIRRDALGVLVTPVALILLILSEVLGGSSAVTLGMPRWVLAAHVTSNLLGTGLLLLAALVGAAYLAQSRGLKQHRAGRVLMRLPGLSALSSWVRGLLLLGLVGLTLGVISGALFAHHATGDGLRVMRLGLSYVAWLVAGGIVVGDRIRGWSGRQMALGAIAAGTLTVVVTLLYVLTGAGGSAS